MQLKNHVALITGGGSGLGQQTAKTLAAKGMKVALLDLNKESIATLANELGGIAIECDVACEKSTTAAINQVVSQFSAIHVTVNCAGIAPAARIVGREGPHAFDLFSKVIQVNLMGTFNVMRLAAHQMSMQEPLDNDGERGVVINTASVAAFEGQVGQVAYSASKGGVAAMTLPAARELSRFGIRVMTIAPGIMHTPMLAAMAEKVQESLAQSVTFPKRLGRAEEYAELVVQIAENSYLNGSVIRLDGGIRMT